MELSPRNLHKESDGDDSHESDDESYPITSINFEDTDIGLTDSLSSGPHERAVLARSQATQWPNVHIQEQPAESQRTPTLSEAEANAQSLYLQSRCRNQSRRATRESVRNRHILPAGALTADQQEVMPPMEYHILKDVWCVNPWPEDQKAYLQDARAYAAKITNISEDSVFSQIFLDTNPEDQFRVGALGDATEIILFKTPKPVGVPFLHKFAELDDPVKCAAWHKKAKDKTTCRGVPPGLIAFAATQVLMRLWYGCLDTSISILLMSGSGDASL
ncbi:hypothetical protein FRC07_015085 [Ceratobasidium sp. 392]|nr:hypothetical protein FRC07_015085 [Ceratobasidium sp. 392]